MVTILSPTSDTIVAGYKTIYLCHLDSNKVTVCNWVPTVSAHEVTVKLPTMFQQPDFYIGSTMVVYTQQRVCPMWSL